MATSRNPWLFSHTVAGAKASAIVYSLVLTSRACNVEPYAYLHHVLTEIPQRTSDADISDLLPFNFTKRVELASTPPVKHPDLGSNPRSPRTPASVDHRSATCACSLSQRGVTATSAKIAGCSLSHPPAEIIP